MAACTVVQSEHLAEPAAAWLAERCHLVVCPHDDPGFRDALADADGLIVRTYTKVNAALLDAAPKLRVVGRAGVAVDNIDVVECRQRGIEVVHAPGSNTQAVVEYVLCLLCDALRPRMMIDRAVDKATWNRLRADVFAARQFNELTLGILGLGRIGRRVAEVARAIGMPVVFHDVTDVPDDARCGASRVSVEALFESSDVISLHIDSRPANRGFVGAALLERMKNDVLLINTSRGFVIDTAALAAFLRDHAAARAMIDVHDPEPIDADYPLLGVANATLLPHLAGRTVTALDNMSWVVRDVLAVLEGREPEHPAP